MYLQRQLCHADIRTTEHYYGHLERHVLAAGAIGYGGSDRTGREAALEKALVAARRRLRTPRAPDPTFGPRSASWGLRRDRRPSRYPCGADVIDPRLDVLGDEAQGPLLSTDPDRRDASRLGGVVEPRRRSSRRRGAAPPAAPPIVDWLPPLLVAVEDSLGSPRSPYGAGIRL
jgi:hypothetical protein